MTYAEMILMVVGIEGEVLADVLEVDLEEEFALTEEQSGPLLYATTQELIYQGRIEEVTLNGRRAYRLAVRR